MSPILRDISSSDLIRLMEKKLGYRVTRQTGSHVRLTTERDGSHQMTVPAHNPIRIGTLSSILRDLASHHKLGRNEVVTLLFD